MWSDPIVLCNDKSASNRMVSDAGQSRDAIIQLLSIISIVVQSAGTAYQRSEDEGDRVVKTVCSLSRQALAELRAWPADQASLAPNVAHDHAGATSYSALMAQKQSHAPNQSTRINSTPSYQSAITTLLLTPRELDVMRLIVQGLSNKEIAATLHLTEGTVKGYVSHLLSKLNVRSRTRAATVAIEQGWV